MNYAIIDLKGHQIKVSPGEEVEIDRLEGKNGDKIKIEKVLLLNNGKEISVGTPFVKKAVVKATILEHFQGKKIRVATFKAKSRYRRVKGFRPQLTKIKIDNVSFSSQTASKKKKPVKKEVKAKK